METSAPWGGTAVVLISLLLLVSATIVVWAVLRRRRRIAPPPPADRAVAATPATVPVPAGPPGVPDAEERQVLAQGLIKTRGGFVARLSRIFTGRVDLDQTLIDQVEEVLFTADIGVQSSQKLIDALRLAVGKREIKTVPEMWKQLKGHCRAMLASAEQKTLKIPQKKPFVILVVGVNGSGKTTTIGKLAARFKAEGRSVVLGAADTFRAAAVDQLEIWGKRTDSPVIRGAANADPASVAVDALKAGEAAGADIVIVDTAGRLHTKVGLMDELQKIRRAIARRVADAPHETLLVLDATTGQNAIAQAKIFSEATEVTGLVLTKLDGTAKGGVVLGISDELELPIRFVGVGEGVDALRPFSPDAFVDALFAEATTAS